MWSFVVLLFLLLSSAIVAMNRPVAKILTKSHFMLKRHVHAETGCEYLCPFIIDLA